MSKKQNNKNSTVDQNIASVGRRFMAFIVDLFYILLLYFGFNIVGKNVFEIDTKIFDYIIIVVCFSYLVIPTGIYGKTIGKWALKISVVNPEGNKIGIGTSFAREIGGQKMVVVVVVTYTLREYDLVLKNTKVNSLIVFVILCF